MNAMIEWLILNTKFLISNFTELRRKRGAKGELSIVEHSWASFADQVPFFPRRATAAWGETESVAPERSKCGTNDTEMKGDTKQCTKRKKNKEKEKQTK